MKNKGIFNISLLLIFLIVVTAIYYFKYEKIEIDDSIKDIKWYKYDTSNGYYETFFITQDNFLYNRPEDNKEYDNCKTYIFDKKNNELKLDCDKSIKIVRLEKNSLILKIDGKEENFFKDINDSLNFEFKSYFNSSISEYKKSKNQVKEFIEIDDKKIKEIVEEEDNYKIIFMGNKCSTIECSLVLDIIEKWIIKEKNIYYFNSNNINENILNSFNNAYSIDDLDNIYPIIIIKENNNIKKYEIKCKGFNCSKYYKNEF